MTGDAVEKCRQGLGRCQPHVFQGLIHHHLLHDQLVSGNGSHPRSKFLHLLIQYRFRKACSQSPLFRLFPVDQVTCQQKPFGPFRPQSVNPHCPRRTSPNPGRGITKFRIFCNHQQIRAESNVGSSGNRIPLNFADHRKQRTPEAHEMLGVSLHERVIPDRVPRHFLKTRIVAFRLRIAFQIITRAESLSCPGQDNHSQVFIGIGLFHCIL